MTSIETILLGIIQGLTEFLPVSSSGHLVLFQNLLGFKEPELLLNASLHMGTLLAVCLYLRSDIRQMATEIWRKDFKGPYASLTLWVLVGTLPTAFIGLVFKDSFETLFGSVRVVGAMLIVTGIILISIRLLPSVTKRISREYGTRKRVGLLTALVVGTIQGLAIIPGISRSGSTIVCGLFCGLDRDMAFRFSFLLSVPAIVGALVIEFSPEAITRTGIVPLLFGFITSAIVGFLSLKLLMSIVRKGLLYYFAPYCWIVGLLIILFV
ncbi:MAG: undecaprenyl-diphosphate phosphatase [Deltaproteobacteria bacterium]|nr:undecaprenyl-diphosphate phosphatase [Deltaproteobacteria bacterium]